MAFTFQESGSGKEWDNESLSERLLTGCRQAVNVLLQGIAQLGSQLQEMGERGEEASRPSSLRGWEGEGRRERETDRQTDRQTQRQQEKRAKS